MAKLARVCDDPAEGIRVIAGNDVVIQGETHSRAKLKRLLSSTGRFA